MKLPFQPKKIYTGGFSTEIYSLCISQENTLYGWGINKEGQLGLPTALVVETPTLCPLRNVQALALGRYHTIALLVDGRVYSFGNNKYFQLGISEKQNMETPTEIECLRDKKIVQIASGGYHTLALTASGQVYGWGRNAYLQLGIEDSNDVNAPVVIASLKSAVIRSIACGWIQSYFVTGIFCVWFANVQMSMSCWHVEVISRDSWASKR
jgi:E3 ubiquitin-protein ligase HERC4